MTFILIEGHSKGHSILFVPLIISVLTTYK